MRKPRRPLADTVVTPALELANPLAFQSSKHTLNGLALGMVWQRGMDFYAKSRQKAKPGEPAVKIKRTISYLIDIRQVLQQGTAVVLAAVNKDALWQAVEFLPHGQRHPSAKGLRNGVGIWEDGNDPPNETAGRGIHPCREYRTDGNFLFIGTVVLLPRDLYPHKEIKYMVISLPQFVHKQRPDSQREVTEIAAPFSNSLPAIADHLRWDMGQKPIYRSPIVGNPHCAGAGLAD